MTPKTLVGKVRLRVLVFVVGVPLAAMAAILFTPGWLTIPVVGVAVYTMAMGVKQATTRLGEAVCWTCGADLAGLPRSEHGVPCPGCGALNMGSEGGGLDARADALVAADDHGPHEA
jgi:hypothetical protein